MRRRCARGGAPTRHHLSAQAPALTASSLRTRCCGCDAGGKAPVSNKAQPERQAACETRRPHPGWSMSWHKAAMSNPNTSRRDRALRAGVCVSIKYDACMTEKPAQEGGQTSSAGHRSTAAEGRVAHTVIEVVKRIVQVLLADSSEEGRELGAVDLESVDQVELVQHHLCV